MLYKGGILEQAFRQGASSLKRAWGNKLTYGLFSGALAFAFFFMAQTMERSIFSETLPHLMKPGYFATASLYVHTAPVLYTLFLLVSYEKALYGELTHNRWYPLIVAGFRPLALVGAKTLALIFSALFTYTMGFGMVVFLTFFLKYGLSTAFLPALYLAGLADVLLMASLGLFFSSLFRSINSGRYLLTMSLAALLWAKSGTGFYSLLKKEDLLTRLAVICQPERSVYLTLAGALSLLTLLVSIPVAWVRARRYYLSPDRHPAGLEAPGRYLRSSRLKGRMKPFDNRPAGIRQRKALDLAITTLLLLFILAALFLNAAILAINATSTGRHVSIKGMIPYVFKTDTMAPAIKLNDLALFKEFRGDRPLEVGEIVLFDQDEIMYVERIIKKEGPVYTLDIDNYPPGSEHETLIKTVQEQELIGVFYARSRWLGALILFANSIFGRITLLLFPILLLFYQRQIKHTKFRDNKY